ncbi:hypothetical protein PVBG_05442 [Plasmodium vivax Brazil I]|uniref:Uncharacterized protein n=1 Tax=Plasmodium vivax (strain Brazil I) TaxID=1033975 RepID=A0A0J9T041_PLAV1|nr:hypothetical protein PVBG_05442 [Plasmodium vivax Brazil I]
MGYIKTIIHVLLFNFMIIAYLEYKYIKNAEIFITQIMINSNKYYEFFENIEDYIEKGNLAESTAISSKSKSECDIFMASDGSYFKDKTIAKSICNEYINLGNSLHDLECISNSASDYKECSKFLNYWINFKLRKSIINEDNTFCHVYNSLESQITSIVDFNIFSFFIHNINKDDMKKMNILYSLYENYRKLKTIIEDTSQQNKRSLLPFSTECCTDYIQAKYICNDDNNKESKFCQKLKSFVSKYNNLYNKFDGKRPQFSDNLLKLEECPNNKIITTAVTGSIVGLIPLLGVLYKVTELNIKL